MPSATSLAGLEGEKAPTDARDVSPGRKSFYSVLNSPQYTTIHHRPLGVITRVRSDRAINGTLKVMPQRSAYAKCFGVVFTYQLYHLDLSSCTLKV